MTDEIILHEPERREVSFMDRRTPADVVATTSLAEAAYYMSGSLGILTYYDVVKEKGKKKFIITLHDLGCQDMRERYAAYCRNEYLTDVRLFFKNYRNFEERCRETMKREGCR